MRKTKGGEGVFGNLRFYLRKIKGGGRRSGDVSPKGKQKELDIFPYGPLARSPNQMRRSNRKNLLDPPVEIIRNLVEVVDGFDWGVQ